MREGRLVYRVNELVFYRGIRWQQDRETILAAPKYRETILYCYLNQKRYERNLDTFMGYLLKSRGIAIYFLLVWAAKLLQQAD